MKNGRIILPLVCIASGVALGIVRGNLALWLSIGTALGTSLWAAGTARKDGTEE